MEQRDQAPEQPEEPQQPQQPAEDIGRAAAEAASLAGEYTAGPESWEPAPRRSPRRALIVGGVAVAVLALAGTATALAGHSHHPRTDTALNAAASSSAPGTTPPSTSQLGTTDGSTTTTGTTPSTPAATTAPSKTPSSPKSSPSKTPSSSSTSSSSQDANGENGDCENTSHDTAADESQKFSGMTHGTQQAFLTAQKAAQSNGLSFILNSGYRSATYQQRIFDCWVHQLGSPQAARQYALPPSESAHVQGYAMDIAPPSAAAWLQSTNGQYGLCRRYSDETWHFEYQARYKTQGCPALLPHP
jgi:LAS superfamily LD-carboxypeptidase LdcB